MINNMRCFGDLKDQKHFKAEFNGHIWAELKHTQFPDIELRIEQAVNLNVGRIPTAHSGRDLNRLPYY